ncbi:MAG: hypothetical protein WDO16_03250 [Bacteroidota bacterium]
MSLWIWKYSLSEDGNIKSQSVLIEQNADGMKTDDQGQLFLATDDGILIVSPERRKAGL